MNLSNNTIYESIKNHQYLEMNLGDMKDLYTENYNTFFQRIKKIQINGWIYCVHGLEDAIL